MKKFFINAWEKIQNKKLMSIIAGVSLFIMLCMSIGIGVMNRKTYLSGKMYETNAYQRAIYSSKSGVYQLKNKVGLKFIKKLDNRSTEVEVYKDGELDEIIKGYDSQYATQVVFIKNGKLYNNECQMGWFKNSFTLVLGVLGEELVVFEYKPIKIVYWVNVALLIPACICASFSLIVLLAIAVRESKNKNVYSLGVRERTSQNYIEE